MNDWIEEEIKKFKKDIEDYGDNCAPDIYASEVVEILEVLKVAKEALKSCEDYRTRNDMGEWFDSDKVDEALAALNALGKETE